MNYYKERGRGAQEENPKENPQRTKGKEPKKSQEIEQEQTTIAFFKKYRSVSQIQARAMDVTRER